ncbi:uncharacterized protein BO95DRAFT_442783 [Aspergillus brunneoviolaceus CBS 621.78]|uniref:Uncharacterized protein n=2 Tax=Aspergillus TaxID=5052 RepID=A0A8G1RGT4_9EURO|nr:hypothetical protein BO95DRAFT_442783 [Aspergillus brunneoviolaceus CBS 621.78]XP_040796144.1 uncharacterized protein BO72DRAFT_452949 [Aspergillus fijiensis CBS 313.89]RAH45666.1 hypothetical protein BO95DRAFT_442783 [Aspergillus brunneoviolaceus CBS 621.78]RAK72132.1 hypothetical protein BO72DRAFT_452949 [Aspergillus fijiensis CBS 313.89]
MKFSIAVVASVLVATGLAMPIPSTSKAPRMDGADLIGMIQSMGGLDGVLKSIQISSPLNSALGQ